MQPRCFLAALGCLLASPVAIAAAPATVASSASQVISLPAIRRVGVLRTHTNAAEIRSQVEARQWRGLLAQPLEAGELDNRLSAAFRASLQRTGRFWVLHSDSVTAIGADLTRADMDSLRSAYDLDAWIEPQIQFAPDHTRVRLFLRDARNPEAILLREDILTEAFPSDAQLGEALEGGIQRVLNGLGHDGSLVWQRDNMVVTDFGARRGLTVGQRIYAGHVLLTAWHPATKEFLRSKRVALMELEVTQVRPDAAVCRVVAKNETERLAAERLLGGAQTRLVVWQDKRLDPDWQEALPAGSQVIVGGAEEGFRLAEEKARTLEKPKSDVAEVIGELEKAPPAHGPAPELPAETPKPPPAAWSPVEESKEPGAATDDETPDFLNDILAAIDSYSLGAGVTYGLTDSRLGAGKTGFAPTLINSFESVTESRFDPDWLLETRLALRYFPESGGSVSGHILSLSVPVLSTFSGSGIPGRLHLGLVPLVSLGQITTQKTVTNSLGRRVVSSAVQSMSFGGLSGIAVWHLPPLPEFRRVTAEAELSLDSAVQGELDASGRVKFWLASLPKEIGLSVSVRKGPHVWQEFGFWFHWAFFGAEKE